MGRDIDRSRRYIYYKNPIAVPFRNADTDEMTYGHNLTSNERRLCALNSRKTPQGKIISWGRNTHRGCKNTNPPRAHSGGEVQFWNYEAPCEPLKMCLMRNGGPKAQKTGSFGDNNRYRQTMRGIEAGRRGGKRQKRTNVVELIKPPQGKKGKRKKQKRKKKGGYVPQYGNNPIPSAPITDGSTRNAGTPSENEVVTDFDKMPKEFQEINFYQSGDALRKALSATDRSWAKKHPQEDIPGENVIIDSDNEWGRRQTE